MISDLVDFLYTKKAWVGAIVAAVTDVVLIVQAAAADEAITFDEAEGIWMAAVAAVGTLGVLLGVYKARNSPAPTTPTDRPV